MARLSPSSPPKVESEPRLEFSGKVKLEALVLCGGKCRGWINPITGEHFKCGVKLTKDNTNFDHRIMNALRPDNSLENCDPLCFSCHKAKTKIDKVIAARAKRLAKKEVEEPKPSRFPKPIEKQWGKKPLGKGRKPPLIDKSKLYIGVR